MRGRRRTDRRKLLLARETIRTLDGWKTLADDQLAQVAGGYRKWSTECTTLNEE